MERKSCKHVQAAPANHARLRIQLLGGLNVGMGEDPLPGFVYAKGKALLAYLAVTRNVHRRESLAGLLWSELPDAEARSNLRVVLSNLRQHLAHALVITRETVALNTESVVWIDVAEFDAALGQRELASNADQILAGLALYQADFLAGFTVPDAPFFEEWVTIERERLRQVAIAGLYQLATIQVSHHQYLASIESLSRLLSMDPWREEAHRQLMHVYALSGQRSAALSQYAACRRILAEELGVEPSDETRAAYEVIRTMPARSTSTPTTGSDDRAEMAPSAEVGMLGCRSRPNTDLIGRSSELARIRSVWGEISVTGSQLVMLVGEAGIGKTRLADEFVAWAHEQGNIATIARCYGAEGELALSPIATWLRSSAVMRQITSLPPLWLQDVARLVPELLIDHPELPHPAPITTPVERMRFFEALVQAIVPSEGREARSHPIVLSIDDLHWCDAESLEWLRFLLRRERHLPVLVLGTLRREEEGFNAALVNLMSSLKRDGQLTTIDLGPFSLPETAELAALTMGRELGSDMVTKLFADTEGNPLFIVESLRRGSEASTQPSTMDAVIAARISKVSTTAGMVMQTAAAIGRISTYAVLAHACECDEESLVQAIEELEQRMILRERDVETYGFVHGKFQEITYDRISTARQRIVHRRIAEALEAVRAEGLETVSGEIASHFERAGEFERANPYLLLAAETSRRLGANKEAIRLVDHALTVLHALPENPTRLERERELLLVLGPLCVVVYGYADTRVAETYARVIEICGRQGTPQGEFQALWGLWLYSSGRADFRRAEDLARRLLHHSSLSGHGVMTLQAQHALWSTTFVEGRLQESRAAVARGLAWYDQRDHAEHVTRYAGHNPVVCGLGYDAKALWLLGYPLRALRRAEEAVQFARALEHPFSLVHALESLIWIHQFLRDPEAIRLHGIELVEWAREHQITSDAGPVIVTGWAQAVGGRLSDGVAQMEEGLAAFRRHGLVESGPYYLGLLADGYLRAGQDDAAMNTLTDALKQGDMTGECWWRPELLRLRGDCLYQMSAPYADVEQSYLDALVSARQLGATSLELRAGVSLGRRWCDTGRPTQAHRLLSEICSRIREDSRDLAEARTLLHATRVHVESC